MKRFFIWGVVCLGVLAVGVVYTGLTEPPEKAFERMQGDIAQERWDKVYIMLSESSKEELARLMHHVDSRLKALSDAKSSAPPSAKEMFVRIVPKNKNLRDVFEVKNYRILSVEEGEDEAILDVVDGETGDSRSIHMVKEYGLWAFEPKLQP